jgi:hypothetical protein
MVRMLLLVVAGLAAGLAIATWWQPAFPPAEIADAAANGAALTPRASGGNESRLTALEAQLAAETAKRAELEQRVAELAAALDELQTSATRARGSEPRADQTADDDLNEERTSSAPPFRGRFGGSRGETPQQEAERLVAAGFSPDRAAWIQQRSAQLVLEAMQAQYAARRDGRPAAAPYVGADRTLRSELGDADYERYLQAEGRPTNVAVQNILTGSPAEKAGFQPGDRIVSYGGQRVFDIADLTGLTLQGTPGESVSVDVLRNGSPVQLVLPRGPIGIGSGPGVGFFRRGR